MKIFLFPFLISTNLSLPEVYSSSSSSCSEGMMGDLGMAGEREGGMPWRRAVGEDEGEEEEDEEKTPIHSFTSLSLPHWNFIDVPSKSF